MSWQARMWALFAIVSGVLSIALWVTGHDGSVLFLASLLGRVLSDLER